MILEAERPHRNPFGGLWGSGFQYEIVDPKSRDVYLSWEATKVRVHENEGVHKKRDTSKRDEGKFQYTGSWKDALPSAGFGVWIYKQDY